MSDKQTREVSGAGSEAVEVKERVCPECKGKLVARTSKFGPFFGCSSYPKCRHVEKS